MKRVRVAWRRRRAVRDDFDPEGIEERLDESADMDDIVREAQEVFGR